MSMGRTRRSSHSGPSVGMVPLRRRTRTAVIFMLASRINRLTITPAAMPGEASGVWRERLGRAELRFVHHALVAVGGMLDSVEQFTSLHRQQTLDGIGARRHLAFETV